MEFSDRLKEVWGVEEHTVNYGKKNVVREKSYEFAQRIVRCSRSLRREREYDLARQLFRSGTTHKMSIASKEARESYYWLMLIRDTNIEVKNIDTLLDDCLELVKLTTSIVKTAQKKK